MADATRIEIYPRRPSLAGALARQAIFWAGMIGVIGLSRVWFGGAWVIDLAALALSFLVVVSISMKLAGKSVVLSKDEAVAWVNAGAPKDVQAWKEARRG